MENGPQGPQVPEGRHNERIVWLIGAVVGCGLACIGAFMPLVDNSATFSQIQGNSALQAADGWLLFLVVAACAITTGLAVVRRTRTFGAVIDGAIVVAFALYAGISEEARTICAIVDGTDCEVLPPGLGVYAIGLGGVLLLASGIFLALPVEQNGTAAQSTEPIPLPLHTSPSSGDSALHPSHPSGAVKPAIRGDVPGIEAVNDEPAGVPYNGPSGLGALVAALLISIVGVIWGIAVIKRSGRHRDSPQGRTAYNRGVGAVVIGTAWMVVLLAVALAKASSDEGGPSARQTAPDPPTARYAESEWGQPASSTTCGAALAVNEHASCAFARYVYEAFVDGVTTGRVVASRANMITVSAWSPLTSRSYDMDCFSNEIVVCSGGDNTEVYFPFP